VVQDLFERCLKSGYVYKGSYTGQYCVFDELYVSDAKPGDPCPDCGRPTETVTEENFTLSFRHSQSCWTSTIKIRTSSSPKPRRNESSHS
jgi:methionyl-tRNA synthetase